jgi:hypothetical protein
MKSRVFPLVWRNLAEYLVQMKSVFSLISNCLNLNGAIGGNLIDRLLRIPSLLRGLAPFGAAPVLLPVATQSAQRAQSFPKNLNLPAITAGTRPKRTDHV